MMPHRDEEGRILLLFLLRESARNGFNHARSTAARTATRELDEHPSQRGLYRASRDNCKNRQLPVNIPSPTRRF